MNNFNNNFNIMNSFNTTLQLTVTKNGRRIKTNPAGVAAGRGVNRLCFVGILFLWLLVPVKIFAGDVGPGGDKCIGSGTNLMPVYASGSADGFYVVLELLTLDNSGG
jgi:hypothetical protein